MACPWKPPKRRQGEGLAPQAQTWRDGSEARGAPSSPSCLLKPPNTWRREAGTILMTPRFRSPACILWWTLYSLSQYYGNTCTQFVTRIYQLYKSFFECIKFKVPVNHPQTISLNKIILLILTDHLFSILLHTESASCSVVSLTLCDPWTVAHQAPLGMEWSRQGYWSGLPFLSPGDLPNPGIEPRSPALQADSLPSERHITHYQTWNSAAGESTQTKAGRGCSSRDLTHCHFQRGQETSWRARSQTQTYITQQSGKGCKTLCGHS